MLLCHDKLSVFKMVITKFANTVDPEETSTNDQLSLDSTAFAFFSFQMFNIIQFELKVFDNINSTTAYWTTTKV